MAAGKSCPRTTWNSWLRDLAHPPKTPGRRLLQVTTPSATVWESGQPRGPIWAPTKQLGPVLLGGPTHMTTSCPKSPVRWAKHPAAELSWVGWNTVGFQKYETLPAHVNLRKPKDVERAFSPSSGRDAEAASRAGCPGQPRLPDCAPVGPPLKAVKAPLLTKKVPPIFKKRQSSYACFCGESWGWCPERP